jgi:2-amino-4-hydroxy-6-hydroxymethyldihydropteridine diphosphokinase
MGSNIGDGAAVLSAALGHISRCAIGDITRSSLWLSAPLGMAEDADWFTNAVVGFETVMSEVDLLLALQEIETTFGRPADHCRNLPRTLDLDIISYSSRVVHRDGLTLPHPRASERLFVLLPLAEVAPDYRLPGSDEPIEKLIRDAPPMAINKSEAVWG